MISKVRYTIFFLLFFSSIHAKELPDVLPDFQQITETDGLLKNQVLTLNLLKDGRLIVRGDSCLSIINENKVVSSFRCPKNMLHPAPNYRHGYTTLIDKNNFIWIKQYEKIWCFDLNKKQFVSLDGKKIDDVFVDQYGNRWILSDNILTNELKNKSISVALEETGQTIHHVETDDNQRLYTFYEDGLMRCYDINDNSLIYESRPYSVEKSKDYGQSSSFAVGSDGNYYLLKHAERSIFLRFSPKDGKYTTIFEKLDDRGFHTICPVDSTTALIGCSVGIWFIDLKDGNMNLSSELPIKGAEPIHTGVNAIALDGKGGLYVGTYGNGLLHSDSIKKKSSIWPFVIISSLVLALISTIILLIFRHKHQLHKEKILLERIKSLMQQVGDKTSIIENNEHSQLKFPSIPDASNIDKIPDAALSNEEEAGIFEKLSEADRAFVAKATALVEQNMSKQNYGVDSLARDMAMERTGLYRYLIRIVKQSPSAFIHGIRMERAAQMLLSNEMTVTEISESLHFSTPSYFARCFKDYFNCKPSEFKNQKKD